MLDLVFTQLIHRLRRVVALSFFASVSVVALASAKGTVYEVGPSQRFRSIGSIPWHSLRSGDQVLIHWREEPYREKWVLCCQGTPSNPITIKGIPGPMGQRPVIDGDGATTSKTLNYWGEERGVLKIGGANHPRDTMPMHLIVESLEIRGGRRPHTFVGRKGNTTYSKDAAAIIVEKAQHLLLRDLILHDCSNGLVVSQQSQHVTVEKCCIYDNGNPGSITEHNLYTECDGITIQYNQMGPLREGCRGNNIKDRSAGLVIRHNWIEGGNRQLDLVDSNESKTIAKLPHYADSWVIGNTIIENDSVGNNQLVHYGGDSGQTDKYRKGLLHFWHNTVVTKRVGATAVFRFSSADETVDCLNNVFYSENPNGFYELCVGDGRLRLGRNWISSGWKLRDQDDGRDLSLVDGLTNLIEGTDPGFESPEELRLTLRLGSPCLETAKAIIPEPGPEHSIDRRYMPHCRFEMLVPGMQRNLGAY